MLPTAFTGVEAETQSGSRTHQSHTGSRRWYLGSEPDSWTLETEFVTTASYWLHTTEFELKTNRNKAGRWRLEAEDFSDLGPWSLT